MNEQARDESKGTWATRMAVGVIVGGLITVVVYALSGDPALYAWPVPLGVVAALSYSRDKAREAQAQ